MCLIPVVGRRQRSAWRCAISSAPRHRRPSTAARCRLSSTVCPSSVALTDKEHVVVRPQACPGLGDLALDAELLRRASHVPSPVLCWPFHLLLPRLLPILAVLDIKTRRCRDSEFKSGSRRRDSNPRPALYESAALPLSYVGWRVQQVYQWAPGWIERPRTPLAPTTNIRSRAVTLPGESRPRRPRRLRRKSNRRYVSPGSLHRRPGAPPLRSGRRRHTRRPWQVQVYPRALARLSRVGCLLVEGLSGSALASRGSSASGRPEACSDRRCCWRPSSLRF
jgi:hypothetical protein